MPTLSWRHHTLIQALLSRGPLKEADFKSIFQTVTEKPPATHGQLFNDFLRKINAELAFVQFELRACRDQYDGSVYYGVVNNVSDEQSKLGTKYSVPQIAFYKAMVLAGTSSQSETEPSQVPAAFRNFSMSQKEKTIEELVKDQWLCSPSDGKIGLGMRSFLDLRSWFRSNEVPTCEVCNEAAVKVESCPNESCNVRIHDYCLRMKFSQRKAAKVCPGCRADWPFTIAKAEYLEEEDAAAPSQTRESSTRKKQRTCKETGADNLVSSSSQNTASTITRVTRRSTRLKSSS
ncbi:PREDICTED: non-structural maintenance of chromosomes element 1 homolog isoform X2 [Ipomoea nil]|uniref:non-structural maintenance of chromosomes element 1 homolog isoform X2 n=1 Tax=Ipomoea nil TaxID=35883 RepID=UPI0009012868|nr:PREDICTED: non-structural maintenance of chromosomes element 1 homolog isoform X2 [Ipomoea nil]